MKFLPFISAVFIHLSRHLVGSYENQCPANTACLNFSLSTVTCTNAKECAFLFHCPEGFELLGNECALINIYGECPDIGTLSYFIEPNWDYQYGNNILNHNSMINEYSTTESYEGGSCRYAVNDVISFGQHPRIFDLVFHRNKRELVLTTGFEVDISYINCYRRDYEVLESVNITRIYFSSRTRQLFRRYQLSITEEPNIFFCYVYAPTIFALTTTQEVVGYSNTLSNKYIAKIWLWNSNFTVVLAKHLASRCKTNSFNTCKVMKREDDAIFYYLQDLFQRPSRVIAEFLKYEVNASVFKEKPIIDYVNNVDFCLPETTSNGLELNWNKTLIGTAATPAELCLDDDGMQIIRRCEGDFFSGAVWLEPSGNCSDTVEIPDRTYRLHRLIGETFITEVFTNISAETDDFKEFTPVDVNLLSNGLKTMAVTRNIRSFKGDFFHGVNNVMRINSSILRDSQEQLNSTDKILDSIETFVVNIAEEIKNLSVTIQSNLLTQISYPFVSGIIGLAIYTNGNSDFSNYEIVNLRWDETFESLQPDKLELAVYVPTTYIQSLTSDFTAEEKNKFKIINTIFYNDGLFNEVENQNRSAGSRIINVNIPGYANSSDIPIHLLFRPVLNFTDQSCAFWDYGQQRHGEWSTTGGQYIGLFHNESLMQCSFNHITHFALLVLSENIIRVEDEDGVLVVINPLLAHDLALTLITLIGCGLSLMGIIAILLSAIIFKGWYKKRLNSIQLAIVMLMEIIVLYVADLDSIKDGPKCMAIGALLHYIVLAKFVWMLIIARIQYLKFVKIFDSLQVKSHVIIHMLIGWILPIIPVILSLLIFPNNYKSGNLNFCYAKGYALYFFLILPACAIILINIAVFVSIMVSVARSKAQDYGVDMYRVQIRLGIMLLFMLGITWIFGIIGEFLPWSWFMLACIYIFCILASLQGFVLFVFTVLMDKGTMELWADMFKTTPKPTRPYERSTRTEVLFTSDSANVSVNYFGKRD